MTTTRTIALLLLACAAPGLAQAAGARTGVEPKHGEIVLLRDVNTRHAYRPMPPSIATIVDPTPNAQIDGVLGTGELSDADFAAMDSGNSMVLAGRHGAGTVERMTSTAVGASLGRATGDGGTLSGGGINGALSTPLGAIGGATRGVGDQVNRALSQFPFGQAPAGNGGP
ncbi:hypothetical protein QFW77_06390 [Luteimonas sp. RD2P54]|uniref:Uncharacterized protein n=1 Tax=Luteimonas endophytica TaxID=3042023 RepID=A0ABT6J7P6_9GAMM|nr:hypothetical protein [Luteimonas endophytica]MDH5822620.1 hypothetical protein [Luteimonas endophytica]